MLFRRSLDGHTGPSAWCARRFDLSWRSSGAPSAHRFARFASTLLRAPSPARITDTVSPGCSPDQSPICGLSLSSVRVRRCCSTCSPSVTRHSKLVITKPASSRQAYVLADEKPYHSVARSPRTSGNIFTTKGPSYRIRGRNGDITQWSRSRTDGLGRLRHRTMQRRKVPNYQTSNCSETDRCQHARCARASGRDTRSRFCVYTDRRRYRLHGLLPLDIPCPWRLHCCRHGRKPS
jgi:hypothetical protein